MSDDRRRETNGNPFATNKGRLPSIPDRQGGTIDSFWNAVKETLEVLTGGRGSRFDSAVTWRDLANLGLDVAGYLGAGRPQAFRQPSTGGVDIQIGNGLRATMTIEDFERAIRGSTIYRDLMRSLNDPARFDELPAQVRDILLKDIAAEARERGADIRRIESKLQTVEQSSAIAVQEVTAATANATAGVRDTVFAYAEQGRAVAGKVTQIKARLDDVAGEGVTLEEVMYGSATYSGVTGQWTMKIDANGVIAGVALMASNTADGPDSAFLIRADRFAIVSPTYTGGMTTSPASNLIPFGVDASGVYINGNVRINTGGTTLDDLANEIGVSIASTSEFFKVDSTGAAVNSSITLTATLQGGLTGTVTWSNSAGWTGTPPTSTNTWTVNAADQTADAVTYTATKVDGGTTYTDSFTIVRLRDGSDALTAILTNENHGVPAAADGTAPVFTGAGGTMKVYRGTTLLTSGVTFALKSGGNPDSLTQSISAGGVYSVTAAGSWGSGSPVTTVTYQATVGSTVLEKVFTLTKNLQGITGTAAQSIIAQPSSLVFRIAKDGTSTPPSITVGTTLQGVSGTITWTTPDAPSHVLHNQTGTSKTIYPRAIDTSPNLGAANSLKVTVTCGSVSDTFTLVRVNEGSDAVTAVLSNESHTVPTASDGSSPNLTGASCTMSVYIGSVDDSTNWTYTTSQSGVSIAVPNIRTVTITGMSADVGYVDITASKATYPSITKRFTVTRAKQGIQGPQGPTGSTGGTGAAGVRGTRQLYLTSGSYTAGFTAAAYKSAATSAIAAATAGSNPTTPIEGDTVTFTNGSTYTTTYTYKLSPSPDWYLPGVVIDGSLLVTGSVTTTAIAVGTLTGHTIQTATSGARMAFNEGAWQAHLRGYDSGGNVRVDIDAAIGYMYSRNTGTITAAVQGSIENASSMMPAVWGSTTGSGPGVLGSAASGTGFGGQFEGNATKGAILLAGQSTFPTNRTGGQWIYYTGAAGPTVNAAGWMCFCNGTDWYLANGTRATNGTTLL